MGRMERYYKINNTSEKRSSRNKDLYKNIYDISEYSNIEGIATIEKNNEINITKVRNTLKNREEYHRQKDIMPISREEETTYNDIPDTEEKNYDIRDILIKAKNNKPKDDYHNLNYNNIHLKEKKKVEDPELENLIDTIENTSKLNKLSDKDLGLDIFSNLKSDNTATLLEGKESVKDILEEAKRQDEKHEDTTRGLDRSFFTSSLSFKDDDFEQIAELNNNIKKNNVLIKVLVFIILLIITAIVIFLVYNKLK